MPPPLLIEEEVERGKKEGPGKVSVTASASAQGEKAVSGTWNDAVLRNEQGKSSGCFLPSRIRGEGRSKLE